jgi:hypothetical protein
MRNSLLPIIFVLALSAVVVPLSLRGPDRGSGGPDVEPMLWRAPVKKIHQVESMPLQATNKVSATGGTQDADGYGLNLRRFVVVAGEDRSPLTAAVMLALAERITAEGGAVILDPLRGPESDTEHVIPLGATWLLRVATVAGTPASEPGGPCHATVRCRTSALRVPADHPAARLQPEEVDHASELTVAHDSRGVTGAWPNWYAGFGRSVADALLERLERGAVETKPDLGIPDWGTRLPDPPEVDVLRWRGAFQHEFMRGWIGRIDGVTTTDREGKPQPTIQRLQDKLKRGGWIRDDEASTDKQELWARARGGPSASLTIRPDAGGAEVVMWQEWPHAAEVFNQWLDVAAAGDAKALDRLRRHRHCEAVPADERQKADALLAPAKPQ